MFYHAIYMITRFSTLLACRFVPWFILVLPEDLVLLVIMVLSRPPGLARCLDLAPWENHDVLGTWDERYLKDIFDLQGVLVPHWGIVLTFVLDKLYVHTWLMSLTHTIGESVCSQKSKTSVRKKSCESQAYEQPCVQGHLWLVET